MDQRISFITLVVEDLQATERFYVDGLGWEPSFAAEGEVLMIKVADKLVLSFWDAASARAEIGPVTTGGTPPVVLAHNLATKEGVDRCLDHVRAAGADPVDDAIDREWGGYTGYFADPDGYRWEVAYNPGDLGQEVLP